MSLKLKESKEIQKKKKKQNRRKRNKKKGEKNKHNLVEAKVKCFKTSPKMAQFLKFKFPIALKFNFNGGQFYKEILKCGYFKKSK